MLMIMDSLMSLRVFATVAEFKSFTIAAARLGVSPAMASKHVMQLESRLGTRLLNRTSRRVSVTESGSLYFNYARQMLDGLDEVEAAVSNVTVLPRGTLKLSAPVWAANTLIARAFADYHRRYPDVRLDVDLSGRIVNLVDEGFDLALRATAPERLDPSLIARPLANVAFHLVGSPSYLGRSGIPKSQSDLNGHSILLYSGLGARGRFAMIGPEGAGALDIRIVMQSESEIMLVQAALEDMGLAFLPVWMTQAEIAAGRLEVVLPDVAIFQVPLYAVYPSKKFLSAKVRTFIDFLASNEQLGRQVSEMHPPADKI
jgi:DNA-binding transcriptional LysR family regulator